MVKQQNNSQINSYLTFHLGSELFSAHVNKVLSILEMTRITQVPKAPDYMKGVINLRGTVLPVVDTRIKFGMPSVEATSNTCILVMEVEIGGEPVKLGAIVDSVQEVIEVPEDEIKPPPSIGSKYKSEFIDGITVVNDQFVMMLNMDMIFSRDEISMLSELTVGASKESLQEIG